MQCPPQSVPIRTPRQHPDEVYFYTMVHKQHPLLVMFNPHESRRGKPSGASKGSKTSNLWVYAAFHASSSPAAQGNRETLLGLTALASGLIPRDEDREIAARDGWCSKDTALMPCSPNADNAGDMGGSRLVVPSLPRSRPSEEMLPE